MGAEQYKTGASGLSIEVHGDLHLTGDPGASEIVANGGARVRQTGDGFQLESHDDCDVTIPAGMPVNGIRVFGDAVVRGLTGALHISRIDGDLRVGDVAEANIGEIMGDLDVEGRVDRLNAGKVHGDATVQGALGDVTINHVDGDAKVEGHAGSVHIVNVGGDVSLRNIDASAVVDKVGGDFDVRGVVATLRCGNVGGDAELRGSFGSAELRTVGGDLSVDDATSLQAHSVGGDLNIRGRVQKLDCRNVGGDLEAGRALMPGGFRLNVGGDASFAIAPQAGEEYVISAGGDVSCGLSADANADIVIRSSEGVQELRAGNGGAKVQFNAGGDVALSGAESVDIRRHVKEGGRKMGAFKIKLPSFRMNVPMPPIPPIPPIPPMPPMPPMPNIDKMVRQQLREHLGQHFEIDMENEETKPAGAQPASAPSQAMTTPTPQTIRYDPKPVTEEERMVILRMLAEKKITVAQAEQLLAALEGGAGA